MVFTYRLQQANSTFLTFTNGSLLHQSPQHVGAVMAVSRPVEGFFDEAVTKICGNLHSCHVFPRPPNAASTPDFLLRLDFPAPSTGVGPRRRHIRGPALFRFCFRRGDAFLSWGRRSARRSFLSDDQGRYVISKTNSNITENLGSGAAKFARRAFFFFLNGPKSRFRNEILNVRLAFSIILAASRAHFSRGSHRRAEEERHTTTAAAAADGRTGERAVTTEIFLFAAFYMAAFSRPRVGPAPEKKIFHARRRPREKRDSDSLLFFFPAEFLAPKKKPPNFSKKSKFSKKKTPKFRARRRKRPRRYIRRSQLPTFWFFFFFNILDKKARTKIRARSRVLRAQPLRAH